MAAAIVPTPTPRIAPKCIKEIARLIATSVQSKQFLMMLNLILLIKEITSTIPSPAATKILARIQRKTPKARMMVLRIQSNYCQNNVSGATQSSRLIEKSIQ